jgi:hypothetical protein
VNSGATYYIPTENQWYKAACYKGGSTNASYWDYGTQSDTAPTAVTAGSTGIGSAGGIATSGLWLPTRRRFRQLDDGLIGARACVPLTGPARYSASCEAGITPRLPARGLASSSTSARDIAWALGESPAAPGGVWLVPARKLSIAAD